MPSAETRRIVSGTKFKIFAIFLTVNCSIRNKDKYHSSHTHSTDCCLQRWLPLRPRGLSGHRGDSKDWSRLWRRRKEWSGAPRPGPPHGGPSLPSGKLLLLLLVGDLDTSKAREAESRGHSAYTLRPGKLVKIANAYI